MLFAPSGKGRKRQKKGEKGRFRPISRKGGQTPLKPPFVTPPFAAAQNGTAKLMVFHRVAFNFCVSVGFNFASVLGLWFLFSSFPSLLFCVLLFFFLLSSSPSYPFSRLFVLLLLHVSLILVYLISLFWLLRFLFS